MWLSIFNTPSLSLVHAHTALVCDRPIEFLPLFESAIRDALEKLVVESENKGDKTLCVYMCMCLII